MKNTMVKTLQTAELPFWFNPQNELFELVYDFDKDELEKRIHTKKISEINVLSIGAFKKDVTNDVIAYTMDETKELIEALGHNYVAAITQSMDKDKVSYLGKGKLEEVMEYIQIHDIDYVVCNHELSTMQFRNLVSLLGVPVIDKVMLVMQLFIRQSHTKEARLQIEITELKYLYPKITNISANKNATDRKHGLFTSRGSGESVVEINRRKIKNKIKLLTDELKHVKKTKEVQGKKRKNFFKIVLVGYTSAGKTTVMNGLTGSEFRTSDRFFQTTGSYYRRMYVNQDSTVLLADTVGFISDLPASWIEGFSTTFHEIQNADLILHVIDSSSPYYQKRMDVVHQILSQIECSEKPNIEVFNKMDKVPEISAVRIDARKSKGVMISALDKNDLSKLKAEIAKHLNLT